MSYDQSFVLSDEPMPSDIKAMEFLYGENLNANRLKTIRPIVLKHK